MRISRAFGVGIAVVGMALAARLSWANGPEIGVNAGAAVPLGKYARTADVGGTFGLLGGYRFDLANGASLGFVGQPQFVFLPTTSRLRGFADDMTSMVALTAGPKLSIASGLWGGSIGAQGGYYRDMSGPLSEDGGGFNISGDVGYQVFRNGRVGLFARFDQANMLPSIDASSNSTRQLFLGGVNFDYAFEPPPPPPPAPTPPPPPPPAAAKRKVVLRGVNFDFNKYNIRPDAVPILNEAASVLKSEPDIRVSVDGYTDGIGSVPYNLKLSDRRADSVARYLEKDGIAAGRMTPVGHGKSDPVASNATAEGRAQNRRVELNVIGGN